VRVAVLAIVVLLTALLVEAHVTVWPQESKAGTGERYTVRVPTEARSPRLRSELEVPADVRVSGCARRWAFHVRPSPRSDRIVAVTWKQDIKPGGVRRVCVLRVNPKTGGRSPGKSISVMPMVRAPTGRASKGPPSRIGDADHARPPVRSSSRRTVPIYWGGPGPEAFSAAEWMVNKSTWRRP